MLRPVYGQNSGGPERTGHRAKAVAVDEKASASKLGAQPARTDGETPDNASVLP